MSSLVLAILLVFGFLTGLVAFDIDEAIYCDLPRCGMENVVCRKTNFSFSCRPRARVVPLSRDHKVSILNTVNKFRNRTAAGRNQQRFPAGRMARIQWSRELEHFAKLDAMSCKATPRPCMTSQKFPNMGSIFDTYTYSGKLRDSLKIITYMILKWAGEARYVTAKQILFLADNSDLRFVFRAALLMSERNTHMGCAAVKRKYQRIRYFYLSCTFATTNILGSAIYISDKTPGKMCQKRDANFINLCAPGEKYHENSKLADLSHK